MLQEKAKDLDTLVDLMNEKLKVSLRKKKIQILIMAPTWSIEKMKTEFSITSYMARTARTLAEEKCILSLPQPKKGKNLSERNKSLVQDFYCNDEYSRVMQSKKDCLNIKKNTHVQKRLILCNLIELYANFKEQHSDIEIGYSTFCLLRPKWCFDVGASGTHLGHIWDTSGTHCVCTIHQNVNLMLSSVKLDKEYHNLVEIIVCSRENKQCMIHRCEDFPGNINLHNYLSTSLNPADSDEEDDDQKVIEELCHQPLCFISDVLTHDVSMVYQIIKLSINFIKENINPNIKTIHYFSDGCAGQYKNCKNLLNLCHHFTNFSVHCTWSFFATSHCKSPCDGLGGTVKRLIAAHSLQSPSHDQIINATQVYDFCRNSIVLTHF